MYDTDKVENIPTLNKILKFTTEYDIYRAYLGPSFKLGRIMSSPMREDKNPSFGVFKSSKTGNLLWKDQTTGDSGNVIKLVEKMYHLNNLQARKKIWLEVTNGNIKETEHGIAVKERYQPARTTISVATKYFTKTDDEYWGQYHINRDLLKRHLVYPIKNFWVNDILSDIQYSKDSPLYAYSVFDKFQIYNPYGNRKDKFRTNCSPIDLYGYEQLPRMGEALIITKSKKDVMVLDVLGYNAVAPTGEHAPIPEVIIEDLKTRFKKFYILYDNDESGINGADKLSKEINITSIHIPVDYYKKFNIKDISDFIKNYGPLKTKELMKKLISEAEKQNNMENDYVFDEILDNLLKVNQIVKKSAIGILPEDEKIKDTEKDYEQEGS